MSDASSSPALTSDDSLTGLESKDEAPPPSSQDRVDFTKVMTIIALSFCFTGSNIATYFGGAALPYVAPDLGLTPVERTWVPDSNTLTSGCIVLVIGYLQDMIGRRVLLAIGLTLTLLGTLLYGLAHSFALALVGNILNGAGSVIQELTSVAAIAELVPARRRGLFLGLAVAMSVVFTPAVLYANLLSMYSTWRWLEWIGLIWNGTTAVMLAFTYFRLRIEAPQRVPAWSLLKEIDYVGIVLIITALAEILVALSSGGEGEGHSWSSAYIVVQLVVGIVLLIAFIAWEMLAPIARPLVPSRLFRGQRVIGLTFIVCFVSGMNYTTAVNLGPSVIPQVFEKSAVQRGLISLLPSVGLAIGATAGNVCMSIFRSHCREVLTISTILMTAFTAAEACISPNNPGPWIAVGTLSSIGIGASLIPLSTLVTLACPVDLIGTAVAVTIATRTVGGTVGYTIYDSIYMSGRTSRIMDGQSEQWASADAVKIVYLVTLAFGVPGILAAAFLPNMKQYMTHRVLTRSFSGKVTS